MEHKDAYDLDRIPFYYSRPDLRPPRLNIETRDAQLATPGYLFTAPTFAGTYKPDSGPYIFDTNGTLIWSGLSAVGASSTPNTHNLHLCTFRSSPHLCLWQGTVRRGTTGHGVGLILDQHYQVVKTIRSLAPGTAADFHEFTLTPEGTALLVTYTPKFVDGLWVLDNCFEEVTLDDNVFGHPVGAEWCATEHIPLSENAGRDKYVAAGGGNGRIPDRAWDYAHVNSVDKTPEGDYLVSARHLDTIFKVSGVDGSILWRLGGVNSSFALDGFTFARQHDARLLDATTVSMFDNANDGVELKDNPSHALVVKLDLQSMSAHQVAEYGAIPPTTNELRKDYIASIGMGNLQRLANGNTLTSFGRFSSMAEYRPSGGEPVFYADMNAPASLPATQQWTTTNYRTTLQPPTAWTGQPLEQPALWTYARTSTNLMTFYVSWNGATMVDHYRFWIADKQGDKFHVAGVWPKQGFETNFTIGSARPWSFAEALDAEGRSLGNSSVVGTYVPRDEDAKACGKWHCFPEVKTAAELLPFGTAVDNKKKLFKGGFDGLGTLALLEHILALVGLGLLAWLVWTRSCRRPRDMTGYSPVDKDEREKEDLSPV
ncbi:hypothetical protein N0V82_004011 [Gnomoniopsis sp. IMI 355080]|nr:hypothetical protein N0V82_004011 [Gnomoniopsis sp. IMI 355080]